jgi:hypothetical protein
MILGGMATTSVLDLKAVIIITATGIRPINAKATTTNDRIRLSRRDLGLTLSTRMPSVTGVLGPVSANEAID